MNNNEQRRMYYCIKDVTHDIEINKKFFICRTCEYRVLMNVEKKIALENYGDRGVIGSLINKGICVLFGAHKGL